MPTRLIREGMLDSERVCALPLEARWLFVTICLCADDVGIFDAAPFALMRKAELQRDLGSHLLGVLADADLIRLYEVGGKRYGFVPRYRQRLQLRRLKHPLPPLSLTVGDPDAARKIKDLAYRFPQFAVNCGNAPPEAEAEAEAEKRPTRKVSSLAPAPASPAPKREKNPRSRTAPVDFLIDGPLQKWARVETPLVDIKAETAIFRNHEFAKARLDWAKTWKNWMLKEQKRLAELARRSAPAGAKSFRERDAAAASAEVNAWTGGRLGAKPRPSGEVIDMEQTHGRLDTPSD